MDALTHFFEHFILKPAGSVLSLQTFISVAFVTAFFKSIAQAFRHREQFTNFVAITGLCGNYVITSIMTEAAIEYAMQPHPGRWVQNLYLAFVLVNVITIYAMYYIHLHFTEQCGQLYQTLTKLLLVLSVAHTILWVKLIVLDIQTSGEIVHYIYSAAVLYISVVMAVVMLFPNLLKYRIMQFLTLRY